MAVSIVPYQRSRASSGASDDSGSATDPEYNKCYGTSKRASNNVQSWLERQAGWETKSKVSELEGLAKDLVADGVQMPANILEDLAKAIESRRHLNDVHKSRGNCDKQHIFALKTFEKVLAVFSPSHHLSQSPSPRQSPRPSPQPSPRQSPRLSPTRPKSPVTPQEAVIPPLKSGNPQVGHPYLNIKPTYMEVDPMWN